MAEKYETKVYNTGTKLAIQSGGEIDVESGASFKLAGTAVTSTAPELNLLDGAGAAVASGTQASKINDPTGGTTTDAEARTAINAIIDALEAFGISAAA